MSMETTKEKNLQIAFDEFIRLKKTSNVTSKTIKRAQRHGADRI